MQAHLKFLPKAVSDFYFSHPNHLFLLCIFTVARLCLHELDPNSSTPTPTPTPTGPLQHIVDYHHYNFSLAFLFFVKRHLFALEFFSLKQLSSTPHFKFAADALKRQKYFRKRFFCDYLGGDGGERRGRQQSYKADLGVSFQKEGTDFNLCLPMRMEMREPWEIRWCVDGWQAWQSHWAALRKTGI